MRTACSLRQPDGLRTLTCSYGGVSKSISVNVGMGDAQSAHTVADFESGMNNLTASDGVTLSRVTDYTSVARGTGSLKAMWNGTGTDGFTISVPAADASSMKHPDTVGSQQEHGRHAHGGICRRGRQ